MTPTQLQEDARILNHYAANLPAPFNVETIWHVLFAYRQEIARLVSLNLPVPPFIITEYSRVTQELQPKLFFADPK